MVKAMANAAVAENDLRFASLLLICFELFLRTGELLMLRAMDLLFSSGGKSAVLNLGLTKSGKRRGLPEQVVLRNRQLVTFLKLASADLAPGDYLFKERPELFQFRFQQLLQKVGLSGLGFYPYSLRRGGITAAFQEGFFLRRNRKYQSALKPPFAACLHHRCTS